MAIQIYVFDLERMFPAIVAGRNDVLMSLVDCFKAYPHCIPNLYRFHHRHEDNDQYIAVIETINRYLIPKKKETL